MGLIIERERRKKRNSFSIDVVFSLTFVGQPLCGEHSKLIFPSGTSVSINRDLLRTCTP